ncbi:hypothetical protein IM538_12605 [Cytobacillus suaedae]|nr:hypothetical protein IM538_12605 [Cytobacillus suaedae]
MAWTFVVTAFIFILFIPAGLAALHILVLYIGLLGLGFSFIFFGLTATQKWNGYGSLKPISWFFRLIALAVGGFILYLGSQLYTDVQVYVDGNFKTIKGVPTEIIDIESNREMVKTITVVIDEISFELKPPSKYYFHTEKLEGKSFTIHYLPNTMWVIDYEVE